MLLIQQQDVYILQDISIILNKGIIAGILIISILLA